MKTLVERIKTGEFRLAAPWLAEGTELPVGSTPGDGAAREIAEFRAALEAEYASAAWPVLMKNMLFDRACARAHNMAELLSYYTDIAAVATQAFGFGVIKGVADAGRKFT